MDNFDYEILNRQIVKCYSRIEKPVWTEKEYILFFRCFFKHYERYRGRQHYRLSNDNLFNIMCELPFEYKSSDGGRDLFSEDYTQKNGLIERYFKTRFAAGCDYSIFHFMSVRGYRLYELYR